MPKSGEVDFHFLILPLCRKLQPIKNI